MSHESATSAEHETNGAVSPEVAAAQEKVRAAREELERAEAHLGEVRRKANEPAEKRERTTLGEVLDDVLALVQKYPIPSMAVAASIGFALGRVLRR